MNLDNRDAILVNIVSNKDHVSDINYSIKYTRWFLRILGIWPLVMSNPTRNEKNIAKILLPISVIFMIILVIPFFAHVIVQRAERAVVIIFIAPTIFQLTNIVKHFIIILHKDSIKLCIQHMETDWRRVKNQNDREIMMRNVRMEHSLTNVLALFMYSGATLYNVVMPLCSGSTINEFNETVRPLPYPGTDVFFDVQAKFIYEIVFCSNFISALFHFTVGMAMCNLTVLLVSHACGQIQIIVLRLDRLVDSDAEEFNVPYEKLIAFIIQNHVRLLKFLSDTEKVLKMLFLVEVITETLIICFVEYCCITEWSNSEHVGILTYVLILVTFLLNLFVYCQVGEVLREQCEEVGKAACRIEWYRLPAKTSLALIMIINLSSDPRNLTAGGMMELSRVSFASIMKASFAYLNILRIAE